MPTLVIKPDEQQLTFEGETNLKTICKNKTTQLCFICNNGVCGSCLIKILEGEENISSKTQSEEQFLSSIKANRDERLGCQCKLFGDVVIEVAE